MDSFRHLNQLVNSQLTVPVPLSKEGFLGRECPQHDCKKYFGIVPGTGLQGDNNPCHCPYCGYKDDRSSFYTEEQIKYLQSLVQQKLSDALFGDLQELSSRINSQNERRSLVRMSAKTTRSQRPIIHFCNEKQLETELVCSLCTLCYKVYGLFAFCPDCGQHNSLQIFMKNLDIIVTALDLSESEEVPLDVRDLRIQDALKNCVSFFDAFGREICRVHAGSATNPKCVSKLSFQNLEGAKRNVLQLFGFELDSGLQENQFKVAIQAFQKRHLLVHKMGIVDAEYVKKSGDMEAVLERKITVSTRDVHQLVSILKLLAKNLYNSFQLKADSANQRCDNME